MTRKLWESDNGKYRVLVRKFEDGQITIGSWKVVEGKNKDIRNRDLPEYVKEKINELRKEIASM